jgi:hypothetical protein
MHLTRMLWLRFLASLAAGLVPARLRCPPAVVTRWRGRAQSAIQTDQAHSLPPIRTTVAAGLSVGIGSRQKPANKTSRVAAWRTNSASSLSSGSCAASWCAASWIAWRRCQFFLSTPESLGIKSQNPALIHSTVMGSKMTKEYTFERRVTTRAEREAREAFRAGEAKKL